MNTVKLFPDPLKVKVEPSQKPLTPHGGLLLISNLVQKLNLAKLIDATVTVKRRKRGYKESESLLAMVYTFLAGGDCLDDMEALRRDDALKGITGGLPIPDPTTEGDFLRRFTLGHIRQLEKVMKKTFLKVARWMPHTTQVTLDLDSSLFGVHGKQQGAQWSYKNIRGFHPLFCFIAQTGEWLHFRFRSGNTYSSEGGVHFLKECLGKLPSWVKRVYARMDSAFYSKGIVGECEASRVGFTITADQTEPLLEKIAALPSQAWQEYGDEVGSEVAEFHYRPVGWPKAYRYVVKRTPISAGEQADLFHAGFRYHVMVTNRIGASHALMRIHDGRGGMENYLKGVKYDWGLEHIPCHEFHANWAYFLVGMLAYNLMIWLKYLALPVRYVEYGIRRMRFWVFAVAGCWVNHGREMKLRLDVKGRAWFQEFSEALTRIRALEFA